ncbi:MAG: hypothetical protein K2X01_02275 [Cyanobacteria bacterium]|nr:hypothetical protein [Cyanobacteriota bacterium]
MAPWPGGGSYGARRLADLTRNMSQIGQIGNVARPKENDLRANGVNIQTLINSPEYAALRQSHPSMANLLASTINGAVASSAAITSYPGTTAEIRSRIELMSQEAMTTGQPVDAFRISPQAQLNQAAIDNILAAQNIQSIANSVWQPAAP